MRVPSRIVAQGSSATPKPVRTRGAGFGLEHTGDRQTNDLQRKIADATARQRFNPFANGTLIQNVTFTAGQTIVLNHGLGEAYSGFFVTRAKGNAPQIWEDTLPTGATPKRQIALKSFSPGIYDIWVFA